MWGHCLRYSRTPVERRDCSEEPGQDVCNYLYRGERRSARHATCPPLLLPALGEAGLLTGGSPRGGYCPRQVGRGGRVHAEWVLLQDSKGKAWSIGR